MIELTHMGHEDRVSTRRWTFSDLMVLSMEFQGLVMLQGAEILI